MEEDEQDPVGRPRLGFPAGENRSLDQAKSSFCGFARMPGGVAGEQEPIGLISRRAWGELDLERARQLHPLLGGNAPSSGIFPSTDFLPFSAFLVHSPAAFLIVEELNSGASRKDTENEKL